MANNFPNLKPALSLDMVNGIYVDSRVTFTRAGTRTYYGQEVVKAEENLFLQSQEVQSWGFRDSATVTSNNVTAPDGTATADTVLYADAATARAYSTFTGNGSAFTFSVFAKYVDKQWIAIRLTDGTSTVRFAWFDIQNGIVGTVETNLTASIVTSTAGFYRCVVTVSSTATSNAAMVYGVSADNVSTNTGAAGSVAIWGAQVEQRSSVTAYTVTTTQPITRYQRLLKTAAANEWPREFDPVTGECLGRSVWESRTNLLLRSEEFDNASWTKVRSSITANQIIAPDGTLTADKLVENTDNNTHTLSQSATLTAVSNTISFYAKAGERSWVSVLNNTISNASAHFNLSSGVVGTVGSAATASIVSVGNGWYRCFMVFTGFAGSNQLLIRLGSADNTPSYTGDGYSGIYIWGAQLEAAAFASPYIPTVAAQVTRLADSAVMTGVNFSSWFNPSEGTLFFDAVRVSPPTAGKFPYTAHLISTTNNDINIYQNGATSEQVFIRNNNVTQATLNHAVVPANTPFSQAVSYKTDDFASCISAGTVLTDTSGVVPVMSSLFIGRAGSTGFEFNGYIKRLTYYPQALTAANLQAVTR